jgi:hypothetical protein
MCEVVNKWLEQLEEQEKTPHAEKKKEKCKKQPIVWSFIHKVARDIDKFFGLDKKNIRKTYDTIDIDHRELEAQMWLNM